MLQITRHIAIDPKEIEISAVRSQGAGGQNVNKVASAVHLRFDITASSLPQAYKARLLKTGDQRITKEGVVVIKAQEFRSQEKNKAAALERLVELIRQASHVPRRRRPTLPHAAARSKRMDRKTRHGRIKALRGRVTTE